MEQNMSFQPSLDEMWNVIESFGIKRKLIDPHDNMSSEEVRELYLTIKKTKTCRNDNDY